MQKLKAKIPIVARYFVGGCCFLIIAPIYCYMMAVAMIAYKLAGDD